MYTDYLLKLCDVFLIQNYVPLIGSACKLHQVYCSPTKISFTEKYLPSIITPVALIHLQT